MRVVRWRGCWRREVVDCDVEHGWCAAVLGTEEW